MRIPAFVRFIGMRVLFLPLQMLGVTLVTFLLVRLLPGNPALLLLGPGATPSAIAAMEKRLGLHEPFYEQYLLYLQRLVRGDLGRSLYTGKPVVESFQDRLPATLELITYSLFAVVVIGVIGGSLIALRPKGIIDRLSSVYGMLAGSFPDFWLGLLMIYFFYFLFGWVPAPIGRIDPGIAPPTQVTGFLTIDSLLAGNVQAFMSAAAHLVLPVATLVTVYTGIVLKMMRARLRDTLQADFVQFARASGLGKTGVYRYALRSALPPVVTMIGLTYGFLLGGAVLVETIFSWGGLGQYAVQAVLTSDYVALQGFVLIAAIFNLFVYLGADVIERAIDPRLQAV